LLSRPRPITFSCLWRREEWPHRSATATQIVVLVGGMKLATTQVARRTRASPPDCVLVAGLDHLLGGEEGSVDGAHVFKQAVVIAAVSRCINHR